MPCKCDATHLDTAGVPHSPSQVKEAPSFSHTETVTTQPHTGTLNEHVHVDDSVCVFESENPRHHSQQYTSSVHTTPPLQPHQPVSQQPSVQPTPPLQYQLASQQPSAPPTLPLQHQPAPCIIVEPPRQNPTKKPPAPCIIPTNPTACPSVCESQATKTQPMAPTSGNIKWDVWPDGDIVQIYSHEDAKQPEINDVHVYWACEGVGAPRKHHRGSLDASEWQDGGGSCAIIVCPTTTKKLIAKQLDAACSCSAMLIHNNCGIIYDLFRFSGGAESTLFQKVIEEHPQMGATQLVMGHPGINGPQESVTTISLVLLNTARVNHKRKKVFAKSQGKDIIADFTEFQCQHPDFVIFHTFKPVAVVITQSPIMLSFLAKNHVSKPSTKTNPNPTKIPISTSIVELPDEDEEVFYDAIG
ncbi:hypothetical protein BDR04DRAFT_1149014 [Suillus decipiens]|nr:hypothetical protein BDR04DRAFT_1149014 [Suillus decipiens]